MASTMIEKEIKIILSLEEYNRLNEIFSWHECKTQTNYYYMDSENILEKKDITVRVREKNDKKQLQIKIPIRAKNSLHIKKEYEEAIECLPEVILGEKLKEITSYDIHDVVLVGKLITLRKKHIMIDGTEICLDLNEYLGFVDYEIEIEYTNSINEEILQILEKNNINYKKSVKGKFSRFIDLYKVIYNRDQSCMK